MRKIILAGIVGAFFFLIPSFVNAQSTGPVKVVGRQLLVDFDRNGIYEPYFIKGVGYSPFPIGRHPSDWGWPSGDPRKNNILDDPAVLNRDFALLQAMHANTIRIWKGNDTQQPDGRYPVKLTTQTLDLAEAYGIKVIAGFWIDTSVAVCNSGHLQYNAPDFTNVDVRNDYINRFVSYVQAFKNHSAILFWAIGNENNLHLDPNNITQIKAWFSLVNEMAQAIRTPDVEGANYHPVAVVNGDIGYIGDATKGASDAQLNSLDIWGANVYRGISFGSFFQDFYNKTYKPLWISEYGVDAYDTTSFTNRPDGFQEGTQGFEDQATQSQWDGKLWDQIAVAKNVTIGATVMEYSDEWWKPYEWMDGGTHNGSQERFGGGPKDTSCPLDGVIDFYPPSQDNFEDGEWWGIVAVSKNGNGADTMTPRAVYDTLARRFVCSYDALSFMGMDNNKSCDGTSACCAIPGSKSKNGQCVSSCTPIVTPPIKYTCFLAGTSVLMGDGMMRAIENVRVGDIVKSADQNGNLVTNKVTEIFVHPQTEGYLLVKFGGGNDLKVTKEHLVYSGGEYRPVGALVAGDPLMMLQDGKLISARIQSIEAIDTIQTVYNFEVENSHTYFANGYLVHNKKAPLPKRP